jgi:hypothetical protein
MRSRILTGVVLASSAWAAGACGREGEDATAGPRATTTAAATTTTAATVTADRDAPAILRVTRRWVRAVAKGDPKAICAASSGQIRRMHGGICTDARRGVHYDPAPGLGDVRLKRVAGDVAFVALGGAEGERPVTLTVTRYEGRWGVDAVVGMRLPGY